jgi:hypothetical protein
MAVPLSSGAESLTFFVRGTVGAEPLQVEIWSMTSSTSTFNITKLPVATYGTITTSFKQIQIPLKDFNLDLNALTKIKFGFFDGAGSGTVYIDKVEIKSEGGDKVISTLDDFSIDRPLVNYDLNNDPAAKFQFSVVEDKSVPGASDDNRVGRLDYTFSPSAGVPYVLVQKKLSPDLSAEPILKFRYNGTGPNCGLDFKIVDGDGDVWVRKYSNITNTGGQWRGLTAPVSEFRPQDTNSKNTLDLRSIKEIDFVVTAGQFGPGTLTIDELEATGKIAFEKERGGSVLQRVATPNNPFSPNGDGIRDTAKFVYALAESARVTLKLYDLRGVPLRSFDMGEQTPGEHVIEWDGRDENGVLLASGLCLFRLEAEGAGNGGHDIYKQVIAISR